MFCYKCKKENLELKDINRLVRENGEEIVICDNCLQEGNLGETLAWSGNNSPY
jgi:protein-arginine kinase activator protein McsA